MKKVTIFYIEGCPHCRKAFKLIEELKAKKPEYANIQIEKIEETKETHIAQAHDYYFVPTFYIGGTKLHEGVPSLDKVEAVLKAAL